MKMHSNTRCTESPPSFFLSIDGSYWPWSLPSFILKTSPSPGGLQKPPGPNQSRDLPSQPIPWPFSAPAHRTQLDSAGADLSHLTPYLSQPCKAGGNALSRQFYHAINNWNCFNRTKHAAEWVGSNGNYYHLHYSCAVTRQYDLTAAFLQLSYYR